MKFRICLSALVLGLLLAVPVSAQSACRNYNLPPVAIEALRTMPGVQWQGPLRGSQMHPLVGCWTTALVQPPNTNLARVLGGQSRVKILTLFRNNTMLQRDRGNDYYRYFEFIINATSQPFSQQELLNKVFTDTKRAVDSAKPRLVRRDYQTDYQAGNFKHHYEVRNYRYGGRLHLVYGWYTYDRADTRGSIREMFNQYGAISAGMVMAYAELPYRLGVVRAWMPQTAVRNYPSNDPRPLMRQQVEELLRAFGPPVGG